MTDDATDIGTDQTDSTDQAANQAKTKTYTKAEVDGMIKKAELKAKAGLGDILELRTKAEQFDALQESSKTDLEKERGRADRATRERDVALTRSKDTLIRSAIISAASRLGSVDPEAVAALLPRADLIVEGDDVIGVEEAVKELLAKKAYLRPGAARGGVEINGPGQQAAAPIARSQLKRWANGADGGMTPERIKQAEEAQKAGKILLDR
jgi:hypothetical protein